MVERKSGSCQSAEAGTGHAEDPQMETRSFDHWRTVAVLKLDSPSVEVVGIRSAEVAGSRDYIADTAAYLAVIGL